MAGLSDEHFCPRKRVSAAFSLNDTERHDDEQVIPNNAVIKKGGELSLRDSPVIRSATRMVVHRRTASDRINIAYYIGRYLQLRLPFPPRPPAQILLLAASLSHSWPAVCTRLSRVNLFPNMHPHLPGPSASPQYPQRQGPALASPRAVDHPSDMTFLLLAGLFGLVCCFDGAQLRILVSLSQDRRFWARLELAVLSVVNSTPLPSSLNAG